MKANIDTVLFGRKVVLVPYKPEHVPKYHEWMLSEELRTLTASDPLSLDQEYEMQQKWQFDQDKLTFIILSREPETELTSAPGDPHLAMLPMVGDVNIFLHGMLSPSETHANFDAEVEIMIAEPSFRRKGLAIEALQLMLGYATGRPQAFLTDFESASSPVQDSLPDSPLNIPVQCLIARIGSKNIPSINLFEKLGFQITKRIEIFDQVEMRYCRLVTQTPEKKSK